VESEKNLFTQKTAQFFPIFWDLPNLTYKFYNFNEQKAKKIFINAINEYNRPFLFGGAIVSSIVKNLGDISLDKIMIEPTIKLALRTSKDDQLWQTLDKIWQRSDLDMESRKLFFI
jgi:hypothetical protein